MLCVCRASVAPGSGSRRAEQLFPAFLCYETSMNVAIIGGGICGLSLALNLQRRGIACRVYERAPEIKALGVGITLLPHAMREFTALGVAAEVIAAGIEN